ncbi:Nif3-like dinuclear metal center hexameric protein [Flavobacteriaceae bacterium F89]|uniref:Nif3-like dinuclear metal center hexameric protein n=1 Tax=Cerina litoralis TaxID=2874477 RepID=A0AAE3EVB4_9FLAO|nr:Nif3-like dinuclear metal center hexameric protein [Cerina litoralis]MCG2460361.1 Nif3-like dinuclear metal center hexameric protein [Cerina litoralis]
MKIKACFLILSVIALMALGMEYPKFQPIKNLTAGEVISRIKEHVAIPWQGETVDTYKGGGPDLPVTGVATTFMATLDVLKRARAQGLNLIITHEPTFYNHLDNKDTYGQDPIVLAKEKYIKDNGLAVFRFHDHWHAMKPDGIYKGVVDKLGWRDYERNQRPYTYRFPKMTLREISEDLKRKFKLSTIRVVGDPDMEITQAGLSLGSAGAKWQIAMLQRDDVQLLIIGESPQWETTPYVADAETLGKKKALIIMGHEVSEEAGMDYCATWLKTFVHEVPVEFVPAGNPFWAPE